MKIVYNSLLAFGLLVASSAFALTIDTVHVVDAGNANDSTGYGGVSYNYYIGTYEVTNSQYTSFLNSTAATDTHGLYNSSNGGIQRSGIEGSFTYTVTPGMGSKPVNYVSFWDAARFANYMTTGNTEIGVYNLGNVSSPTNSSITRDSTAFLSGGVAVASEDEWYKAAYYKGGSTAAGYWKYAHQSDSITTGDANYDNSVGAVTDVGTYSDDASYYGTFDQGGNVWEFSDTIIGSARVMRGGAWGSGEGNLQSLERHDDFPTGETAYLGFRVTSIEPIPEPSAYAAILGCLGLSLAIVRRRIHR